jgi:hypothetical protein
MPHVFSRDHVMADVCMRTLQHHAFEFISNFRHCLPHLHPVLRTLSLLLQRVPGQLAGYVVLREKTASRNKENSQFSDPLRPGIQEAQVCVKQYKTVVCVKVYTLVNASVLVCQWLCCAA